jgi:hypothetical protein
MSKHENSRGPVPAREEEMMEASTVAIGKILDALREYCEPYGLDEDAGMAVMGVAARELLNHQDGDMYINRRKTLFTVIFMNAFFISDSQLDNKGHHTSEQELFARSEAFIHCLFTHSGQDLAVFYKVILKGLRRFLIKLSNERPERLDTLYADFAKEAKAEAHTIATAFIGPL